MAAKRRGFVLGDHEILHPDESGSLARFAERKRAVQGAPPPPCFDGILRAAAADSPSARNLFSGEFCGHGEPTMTIFDVVIDGAETLELGALSDQRHGQGGNVAILAARPPGRDWRVLFRREWEDARATLEPVTIAPLTAGESARLTVYGRARISMGFEYPCDATSRAAVSWVAIDVVFENDTEPGCVVSAELA